MIYGLIFTFSGNRIKKSKNNNKNKWKTLFNKKL